MWEDLIKALIAKQVWRILTNPDSLVSWFLKRIYFRNTDIMSAELGKNSSFVWKSLVWGQNLLMKGMRYRVGNGESILMFKDPWILRESSFNLNSYALIWKIIMLKYWFLFLIRVAGIS